MTIIDTSQIIITPQYERTFKIIDSGTPLTFISGPAGTGKSVLIDYICEKYKHLNFAKVGPTGISALNIGGATIHKLFKFPYGVITTEKALMNVAKMYKMGLNDIFERLDLLIIDEIPMVRADMFDGIDMMLRRFRRYDYPFGGVQVLSVGDMFQLPPVLTDKDRPVFDKKYDVEYFFGSKAFDESIELNMFDAVVLDRNFRQGESSDFKDILNNLRVNKSVKTGIQTINDRCYYNQSKWDSDSDYVILCTTNKRSTTINSVELSKLTNKKHTFEAIVMGEFDVTSVLTPTILELKEGCKIMFTKNDINNCWVNGTIGIVTNINTIDEILTVEIPSTESVVYVKPDTWNNIDYILNPSTNKIEEVILGSFTQFPVMLAYAITIHKSQGLTFDKVHLEMGSGAFTFGQTYVGLSRCRTLEGLHLATPIERNDIRVDPRIIMFYEFVQDFIK